MNEACVNKHEYNADVIKRLKRVEGQIKGIVNMVEDGADCDAVLTQLLAAKGALKTVGNIVIKDHLTHCVKESIERGESDVMEAFSSIIEKFIN